MTAPNLGSLALRMLTPSDANAFRDLRLEALERHPRAFASSPHDWLARTVDDVRESLQRGLASGDYTVHGAFDGEHLVGIMALDRDVRQKLRHRAYLVSVYVTPSHRSQGIAGRLLEHTIAFARTLRGLELITLGVGADNTPARQLYERHGFRTFGVEPNYLKIDGSYVDEAHMQLPL